MALQDLSRQFHKQRVHMAAVWIYRENGREDLCQLVVYFFQCVCILFLSVKTLELLKRLLVRRAFDWIWFSLMLGRCSRLGQGRSFSFPERLWFILCEHLFIEPWFLMHRKARGCRLIASELLLFKLNFICFILRIWKVKLGDLLLLFFNRRTEAKESIPLLRNRISSLREAIIRHNIHICLEHSFRLRILLSYIKLAQASKLVHTWCIRLELRLTKSKLLQTSTCFLLIDLYFDLPLLFAQHAQWSFVILTQNQAVEGEGPEAKFGDVEIVLRRAAEDAADGFFG